MGERMIGTNEGGGRGLRDDERAQSVVIGTILVFALGVALLGLLQVTLIPSSNADVEAQHSQQVRGEMQDLRNDIQRAAVSGGDLSQGVKLGIQYPSRAFFLNPGPAAGSINTAGTSEPDTDINIRNAEALNEETADYWNGNDREFGTGAVVYRPGYNIYDNAPNAVVIENSLVYSAFDDNTLLASDQQFVNGRELSLVALDGRLSQSQVSQYTVDTTAVSASRTTIAVEDSGSNIQIDVATRLSEETLVQDVLAEQIDDSADGTPGLDSDDTVCSDIAPDPGNGNNRYIVGCSVSPGPDSFNILTLTMEQDETYNLKLSKVGVGTGATYDGAHYITTVTGSQNSLVDVERREVVFEVRDRFNNPVSGEEVPLKATNGIFDESGSDTLTATTNEEGRISVTYIPDDVADGGSEDATVVAGGTLDLDGDGDPDFDPNGDGTSQPREEAEFEFTVVDSEADTDVGASINPAGPIILSDSRTSGELGGSPSSIDCNDGPSSGGECYASITLSHDNPSGVDWKITDLRYHFYIAPGAPGNPEREAPPENVEIYDTSDCDDETYQFQSNYKDASQFDTISVGSSKTFILDFNRPSGNFETIQGDGFFVTLKFESADDPSNTIALTYFASPTTDTSLDNPCPD